MISGVPVTAHDDPKRHFIRHPSAMPIACRSLGSAAVPGPSGLCNMGLGGLSFLTDHVYSKGDELEVSFPSLQHAGPLHGIVVWMQDMGSHAPGRYVCGVQFSDHDTHFRARLVEQICHIEAYRLTQMRNGRILTSHQAAEEWVTKFAHRFPR